MESNWFVAASIVGKERNAAARLESRFEIFLPLQKVARYDYSERFKDFYPRALFPGYFFVRCNPELRPLKHCEYRGLIGLGGAGVGEPLPIDVEAIEELRAQMPDGIFRHPKLKPGTLVEIQEKGSIYWGKRGLYECESGDERVIVLLDSVTQWRVPALRSAVVAITC